MFFVVTASESHCYRLRVGSTRWKTSDLGLQASGPVPAAAACEHWPETHYYNVRLAVMYEHREKPDHPLAG
jgi:hypothetical protein